MWYNNYMTLLIKKFNYTSLDRETIDGTRLYATPTGEKLASVTTILDKTKSEEKKAILENWKTSVGHAKAAEIVEQAASRGTRMHKFLEDYIDQGFLSAPGTNPYSAISHAMARTIVDNGLVHVNEVWGSEVALYYSGLYAGTTDAIGVWKGNPAIIDFKQSNKVKKREWIEDYFLQLAAYALSHNHLYNTEINTGVILMCVQPTTNAKLEIVKQPQYLEFVVSGNEFEYWTDQWLCRVEQYYRLTEK